MSNMISAYDKYYNERQAAHVYPVEFVVRTLLGRYPDLSLDKSTFVGKRILDLGYGDGRNMPLLFNLGFDVSGVEISDEINRIAKERFQTLGVPVQLSLGHNTHLPFTDAYFDYLLACHSCYYVSEEETFADNLREISRVLTSKGVFICSLPKRDTYILADAESLPGGHFRIKNDPYHLRNGTVFRAFVDEEEIKQEMGQHFTDFRIGSCDDNFYGIDQKVWIVTCWKK